MYIYSCYSVPVNQYLPWFAGLEYLTPEVMLFVHGYYVHVYTCTVLTGTALK